LLSHFKRDHQESYRVSMQALTNIHKNIQELLKITHNLQLPNSKTELKLFSTEKSKKYIIESNTERKIDNLKQICGTLETLQD